LLPTDMLVGWGPEPRFCSFVFSHEIFKPSGAAAVLKLDKQDAALPMDGSNSAVSSEYTRSVMLEFPMLVPGDGRTDMFSKIRSIATQNSVGARMHPCLTPDVVWNRPGSLDLIRTRAPVDWWRASIDYASLGAIPLIPARHVTLALSSAYSDGAARLPHLSIMRSQLLPHLTMHYPSISWLVCLGCPYCVVPSRVQCGRRSRTPL